MVHDGYVSSDLISVLNEDNEIFPNIKEASLVAEHLLELHKNLHKHPPQNHALLVSKRHKDVKEEGTVDGKEWGREDLYEIYYFCELYGA
jgi:hypothetical protein